MPEKPAGVAKELVGPRGKPGMEGMPGGGIPGPNGKVSGRGPAGCIGMPGNGGVEKAMVHGDIVFNGPFALHFRFTST